MWLKKRHWPVILFTLAYLAYFLFAFILRGNYEFVAYEVLVLALMFFILYTDSKFNYPLIAIWGVSIWGLSHMAGGGILVNGKGLYSQMLIPLVSSPYSILRYDQLIHAFCYFIVTIIIYSIISGTFKSKSKFSIAIFSILAAIGVGALNEIGEFMITVFMPNNGVGDYINNALDLVFNFLGSLIAASIILIKKN